MGSELGHFWRYRVGDHRLIHEIQDAKLTLIVVVFPISVEAELFLSRFLMMAART